MAKRYGCGDACVKWDALRTNLTSGLGGSGKINAACFEAHAVQSKNLFSAIHDVAVGHGFKERPMVFDDLTATVRCGDTNVHVSCEDTLPPQKYDPEEFIRRTVDGLADGDTHVLIFHPGYLDAFILDNSSLMINRAKEVDVLTSPGLRTWLKEQRDLRSVDYRDL